MWQIIKSVLAAFFGVQKEQQRRHDFEQGKPAVFIVVGIALALVMVIAMICIAILAAR